MSPGDVITGDFRGGVEESASPSVRPIDTRQLTQDLLGLAQNDISVFHFQTLVKLSKGEDVHDVHDRVFQKIEPFLDGQGRILPEVSALLNDLYPSRERLHSDNPNLAKSYATDFNRRAKKTDIPEQEQRWAFIRCAQERLKSYHAFDADTYADTPPILTQDVA